MLLSVSLSHFLQLLSGISCVPSVHFTHFTFQVIDIQSDWQTFEKISFVSRDLKLQELQCTAKGKIGIGIVESSVLAIIQNNHLLIILTLSLTPF